MVLSIVCTSMEYCALVMASCFPSSPISRAAGRTVRILGTAFLLAATVVAAAPARGQDANQPAGVHELQGQTTAGVVIDGVELFRVRGVGAYPASQRAADVTRRIIAVADDPSLDVSTIRVEESELGSRITVGDGTLAIIVMTETDARLEETTATTLARIYMSRVSGAVTTYRELRMPDRLLRSALRAAGATLLLIALLMAGRWIFRRLDGVISRRLETQVERLRIQSFRLLSVDQTLYLLRGLLRGLRIAAILTVLSVYLTSTLSLFPWTRGLAFGFLDLFLDPLATMARAALAAVPDLVFLAVLALVTRLLLRLIRAFFLEIDRKSVVFEKFDSDWAMPTYRLVRILVIGLALVAAFPSLPGSDTGAFQSVSLFIGVLVSLGSSSIIGNIIAGYTMTYRRAFRDGDRIRVGDVVGEVTQTRLLVTHVRTPKNEDVVIPNSIILSNNVINYSAYARQNGLILHTTVGIGYEVPWRQVEAMLLVAAERTQGLLREPPPFVLQTALGDFAVTYELNAYCDAPQRILRLYAEMHRQILDVFNEHGVQIMTPAYESDPSEPKLVPPARWYSSPARPPGGAS